MKAVTVHLDEDVYLRFQTLARMQRKTASELIRQAMLEFPLARKPMRTSLLESPPAKSVGVVTKSWAGRQDLLEDYLDRK